MKTDSANLDKFAYAHDNRNVLTAVQQQYGSDLLRQVNYTYDTVDQLGGEAATGCIYIGTEDIRIIAAIGKETIPIKLVVTYRYWKGKVPSVPGTSKPPETLPWPGWNYNG